MSTPARAYASRGDERYHPTARLRPNRLNQSFLPTHSRIRSTTPKGTSCKSHVNAERSERRCRAPVRWSSPFSLTAVSTVPRKPRTPLSAAHVADVLAAVKRSRAPRASSRLLHGAQSEPKRVLDRSASATVPKFQTGDRSRAYRRHRGALSRKTRNVTSIAFALTDRSRVEHAAEAAGVSRRRRPRRDRSIRRPIARNPKNRSSLDDDHDRRRTTGDTDVRCNVRNSKRARNAAEIVGEAVNFARILALTPANDMTPSILAVARGRHREEIRPHVPRARRSGDAGQGHGFDPRRLARQR